jgi:hypothetical protein
MPGIAAKGQAERGDRCRSRHLPRAVKVSFRWRGVRIGPEKNREGMFSVAQGYFDDVSVIAGIAELLKRLRRSRGALKRRHLKREPRGALARKNARVGPVGRIRGSGRPAVRRREQFHGLAGRFPRERARRLGGLQGRLLP